MDACSLGQLLAQQIERHADRPAMLAPEKDRFREIRYRELGEKVRGYAGALQSLGLSRGQKVAILADNGVEWAFTDWACSSLGLVSVPIYPTLPADQAQYIVCDSEASLVVCGSADQLAKVQSLDGVRSIALTGAGSLDELARSHVMPLDAWKQEVGRSGPEDLFTIIYTSGTTGQPKGAMIPHRAPLHVCRAAMNFLPLYPDDVFLSFLPMSHVYERVAGQVLPIAMGASIGYAKSLASLANDMQKVRPTIMLCVPRFLEAFRDRVMDQVGKQPPLRQKLFHLALAQSLKRSRGEFAPLAGLLDKLALSKVRERTGGRLRFFVSGGAALPTHVAEFLTSVGLLVLQGYGLTETTGGTCINHPDHNRYWTVGEPLDMEVAIAEDGEILVRGPAVMQGYYNLPEETEKVLDREGWFHTGDIGEFEGKLLKITDRKKDLIVLGNGKNVAPQPIENRLRESPYIAEAVVFGDGMDACVGLIVPNEEAVRKELGLAEAVALQDDTKARALIKAEIDRVNKTLAPFQMVKRHALLDKPFSIDSGELTPTLKVKRKVVAEKYRDVIDKLA